MTPEQEKAAALMATPSGYAESRLGFALQPKQARVLDDLFSKRKQRVAFLCGNEVGKTSRVAVAAILYALEMRRARVQMTSGSDRQLSQQLVPNLKRLSHLFTSQGWEFLDRAIKVDGINQFIAYAARDEGTFQGFHEESEGGERIGQLIIVDEAAAVRDEIIGAAEDRCNPTWLLIMGSPLDPSGKFYSMTRELSQYYACHRLSKLDCTTDKSWPGGKGWLDPEDIARTIAKNCGIPPELALKIVKTGEHGGVIKDQLTLSSVFAEFSSHVENSLLTLGEYQKCQENPPTFEPIGDRHIFCDFAGGRAKNVCAVRVGNRVFVAKKWVEPNEMAAVGEFVLLFKQLQNEYGFRGEEISGDGDGLGGPMVRRIQELGWPINDFHGGSAPRFSDRYADSWTEAWCEGAGRIKQCNLILPPDQEFRGQALGRKTKLISSGKLKLETKEEMRKRGLQSPDEADAIFGCMMPAPLAKSVQFVGQKRNPFQEQLEEFHQQREGVATFFQ